MVIISKIWKRTTLALIHLKKKNLNLACILGIPGEMQLNFAEFFPISVTQNIIYGFFMCEY